MPRLGSIDSQYFDSTGDPLSGGRLYFYETETDIPKTTYIDSSSNFENRWPIVLDAAGVPPPIFFHDRARVVLTDSEGVEIRTMDPLVAYTYTEQQELLYRLGTIDSQLFDQNGKPLPFGKLFVYENGTSTRKETYSENGLTAENPWPVVFDETGFWGDIFFQGKARLVLQDRYGVQQRTLDDVETVEIEDQEGFILSCPESLTVAQGADATFYVQLVGPAEDYTIQWFVDLESQDGENGLSFTMHDVTEADNGKNIWVTVSDGFGTQSCGYAVLTIDDDACSLVFPTEPITATELIVAADNFGNTSQVPGNKGAGGVFWRNGNEILASLQMVENGKAGISYSDDYGVTWSDQTPLPLPTSGPFQNRYHFPREIVSDGDGGWWIWAIWLDNRSLERYYTNDNGITWVNYPFPRAPNNPTRPSQNYGPYGFELEGQTEYIQLSRYFYDESENDETNFCAVSRRDRVTGDFYAIQPFSEGSNGVKLLSMPGGFFSYVFESDQTYSIYYSDINLNSYTRTWPTVSNATDFCASETGTVLVTSEHGNLLQFTAPGGGSSLPEIPLEGQYIGTSTTSVRTAIAKKSDMWLVMNVREAQSVARLYHSTDEDGSVFSSDYIDLILPGTPADGADYVELHPGEDNYWYGSIRRRNPSRIVLFKFPYETRVGNCP